MKRLLPILLATVAFVNPTIAAESVTIYEGHDSISFTTDDNFSFYNHNGSKMIAIYDGHDFTENSITQMKIVYLTPNKKLKNIVKTNTVLFQGEIKWKDGFVSGYAHSYKQNCLAIPYYVNGYLKDRDLTLSGPAPKYIKNTCDFDFSWNVPNAKLIFEPLDASIKND